ncbi:MAG: hypothetical protein A2Y17_06150 [Clostridiales bacterium GWF2_38_85]|nr:MAG: hypothetical protein A2Y17_06150 [Clostridiales bacterium GWF2_38_85]HBL85474.1 chromosomal replication initiator protein DnaA [Clostridiales bacterium]
MNTAIFKDVWSSVLESLAQQYSDITMRLWFNNLELAYVSEDTAYLVADNEFKKDIVEKKYLNEIKDQIEKVLGFPVSVAVTLKNEAAQSASKTAVAAAEEIVAETDEIRGEKPLINPNYTFDSFVIGSSNKLAHAACSAVANSPARAYNPLFIYGESGLGKTHLLFATINAIKKKFPSFNVVYVKGEEFTNQMIDSISKHKPVAFREKFRNADVLLVDDIQFIAGKEGTQEEFFHTFNALYEQNKQIVLTSDRPPKDIQTLEGRLRSRFEWGLIADIQPPDYELRVAILKRKAEVLKIPVSNEVLSYLAENIKDNIRQIEGAIKKLNAYSLVSGNGITMELAKRAINDIISESKSNELTADTIIKGVSARYDLSITDIKGRKRNSNIIRARNIAIHLMRSSIGMSLPAIGRFFERDHTTILNSVTNIESELKSNPALIKEIDELVESIKNS